MAFDTLIDKSNLETAMTATATAIRGKTGESGKLTWDQAKGFADAVAAIATGGTLNFAVVRTVTLASDITGSSAIIHPMLTGDDFIKEHYASNGFVAVLIPDTPAAAGTNVIHFGYHGNKNIGASGITRYGFGFRSTNTSTVAQQPFTVPINGTGYSHHMRVDRSGNLYQYVYSGYVLKAGTYTIVLMDMEA